MSGSSAAPLHARTVIVPLHAVPPDEQGFATFGVKDPVDVLLYKIDATVFLTDAGSSISGTPSVLSNSTDLVISNVVTDGLTVTFEAAGGVNAHVYGITLTAALTGGGVLNRTFWLPVAGQFGFVQSTQRVINIGPPGPRGLPSTGSSVGISTITVVNGQLTFTLSDGSSQSVAFPTVAPLYDPTDFALVNGTLALLNPQLIADGYSITVGDDGQTISANVPVGDGLTIQQNGQVLSVISTPFTSLSDIGAIQPADEFQIVRNGTVYSTSIGQLVLDVGAALQPALAIDQIADQPVSTPFVVTGEVLNYQFVPVLSYADPDGVVHAFPTGSAVTSTGFTFTHPGLAAASNAVLTVQDANGISAASMPYNISPTVASAATLTGVPATAVHGVALTGITLALTPSNAGVYVILLGPNGQEGARVAAAAGALPSMTPAAVGSYRILVFASHGGGPKLLASNPITVT